MSFAAHHLVRRAVDTAHYASNRASNNFTINGEEMKALAPWGIALLAGTGLLYLLVVASINYTYGHVVAALTMVETPTATAFKSTKTESVEVDAPLLSGQENSEKEQLQALEADLFLVKQKPITAKLCTTVKHLRAVGGRWSRFRGLQVAILYNIGYGSLVNFLAGPRHFSPLRPLAAVLVSVALFRVDMLWTHIVISNPSDKPWYRRMVPTTRVKGILMTTAACVAAQELAVYLPALLFAMSPRHYGIAGPDSKVDTLAPLAAMAMWLVSLVLVVIPAQVTLTRVQASMLSDADETIVPFDRSFGGRVTPEILGGSGCVGMVEAWRSFDKEARVRLLKLYLKIGIIQIATAVFFIFAAIGELRLIMGPEEFKKALDIINKSARGDTEEWQIVPAN